MRVAQTAPETIDRAAELYRAVGMSPLHVRREIDGFIADRLMEALWREALWLVDDDVATVDGDRRRDPVSGPGCGGRSWGRS